mgnify:CR=1 FL=1
MPCFVIKRPILSSVGDFLKDFLLDYQLKRSKGIVIMPSSISTEFFVSEKGTKQTLSALSKIEVFVNGVGGKYLCEWTDDTEGHNVALNVEVPLRSHVMEVNQHLVEIKNYE